MKRRGLLAGTAALIGVSSAGCLGDSSDDSTEHLDVEGVEVPLVSVAEAAQWYEDGATVFLDARPEWQYNEMRIEGAEHSVHPDGRDENDPTEDIESDTRVVTYCVCPHAQAGMRGASLIEDGYSAVYALDEGLEEWYEQGHPVSGTAEDVSEPEYHESLADGIETT